MNLLLTVVLGAFVGWIASIITKRDEEQGWIGNILIGIVGAFIGTLLSRLVTGGDRSALEFDVTSLLWALGGAVVLCLVINQLQKGRLR